MYFIKGQTPVDNLGEESREVSHICLSPLYSGFLSDHCPPSMSIVAALFLLKSVNIRNKARQFSVLQEDWPCQWIRFVLFCKSIVKCWIKFAIFSLYNILSKHVTILALLMCCHLSVLRAHSPIPPKFPQTSPSMLTRWLPHSLNCGGGARLG